MKQISICVIGWHFHRNLFDQLLIIHKKYPVLVVCHTEGDTLGLPKKRIENIGLEFGAYNYYVKNIWKEDSNVLFLHDDTRINATCLMKQIENIKSDHAFIFGSQGERDYNSGGHGRAMYCSRKFLLHAKSNDGFWFDSGNKGFVANGHYTATKPPEGCKHHNKAMHVFMQYLGKVKKETDMLVGIPLITHSIINGRRGKF